MAYRGRFLHTIRASLSALSSPNSSFSHSRNRSCGKYELFKMWLKGLEPLFQDCASRVQYKLNTPRKCMENLSFSGRKLSMGRILGVSVVTGSLSLWVHVAYAMNGTDIMVEEQHEDMWGASSLLEDDRYTILALARKFWLPAFLVMTVVMSWDHPVTLVIKVFLYLLSTKPSPLSVYLFVEQLHHQFMRHDPHLYRLKTFYAKKVEVEDYKLLCLARVELRDQNITLIGILGSWWVLHSSPCQGGFSLSGTRALKNR